LLDPICLLEFSLTVGDNKVWYPGVVIKDEPFRVVTGGKGDGLPVGVQTSFEVLHFVSEGEVTKDVLFLLPSNGGSEALGNVKYSDGVVLVEVHYSVGSIEGDGSWRSCGGLYGGQRANGHFDQSIDSDGRHGLGSIGVVIGAGVVFAEVGVDESMVGRLVVDPQKEELSQL
jgi:hypothetical protein